MRALYYTALGIHAAVRVPRIIYSCYRVSCEATRAIGDDEDIDTRLLARQITALFIDLASLFSWHPYPIITNETPHHMGPRQEVECQTVTDLWSSNPKVVVPNEPGLRGKYFLSLLLTPVLVIADTLRKVTCVATLILGLDKRRLCFSRRCFEITREALQLIFQPVRVAVLTGSITVGIVHPATGQKMLQLVGRIFGESSCLILRKLASSGNLSPQQLLPILKTPRDPQKESALLQSLPHIELEHIVSFLPPKDRAAVARICTYVTPICRDVTLQKAQEYVQEIKRLKGLQQILLQCGVRRIHTIPGTQAEAVALFNELASLIKNLKQDFAFAGLPTSQLLSSAEKLRLFLEPHHEELRSKAYQISTRLHLVSLQKNERIYFRFSISTLGMLLVAAAKKKLTLDELFSGRCHDLFAGFSDHAFLQQEWESLLSFVQATIGLPPTSKTSNLDAQITKRADPLVRFLIQVHQQYREITYEHRLMQASYLDVPKETICPISGRPIQHAVHHKRNRSIIADQAYVKEKIHRAIDSVHIGGKNYWLKDFETEENHETQEAIDQATASFRTIQGILAVWDDLLSKSERKTGPNLSEFPSRENLKMWSRILEMRETRT